MNLSAHSSELHPLPLSLLMTRLADDLEAGGAVFGLARKDWWLPQPGIDVSIEHVGTRIATPAGPASGPHTQLAQNIVLAWLAGARFIELKTVQILDELRIPRPCISVPHVGYNVEWSQELRVHQSAKEYGKAWYLLHAMLAAGQPLPLSEAGCAFDMSVGYDLRGISDEKVDAFIETMKDAGDLLEALRAELRAELPRRYRAFADVAPPRAISGSVTLSTFHGCPAHEIEAIASHLLLAKHLHTVIKLNPTLIGFERCRHILHDELGYDQIALDRAPFEKDLHWDQLLDMVPRLRARAANAGLHFGVKLSNTLVMQSPEPPFGSGEMYLSGAPLHVIALTLAGELRRAVGPELPITFSAGVDADNFHDCVAAGMGPVTSCTDLLKNRGYARLSRYLRNLEKRMADAGVRTVGELRRQVDADSGAGSRYLEGLPAQAIASRRYHREANRKPPRKVGSTLQLFDCLTCDLCIPVCPNAANFTFAVRAGECSPGRATWREDGAIELHAGATLRVEKRHQIGCTADLCNQCGQCDVWCPEEGGPFLAKANVFVTRRAFEDRPERAGFWISSDGLTVEWRRAGEDMARLELRNDGEEALFSLPTGTLRLRGVLPITATGRGDVDLTVPLTMHLVLDAVTAAGAGGWLARAKPPQGAAPV
ncbi:MAG: glutamate synthase [Candidatus Schekmanbacteria bacterium]|nr:glutamate synthase [Candidatus Schekmanbacteria bacterium]